MRSAQPTDIGVAARNFVQSVALTAELSTRKLLLIRSLVHSDLFRQPGTRSEVFETIVRLVMAHINESNDERAICILVLRELVLAVQSLHVLVATDLIWFLSNVLPDLTKAAVDMLLGVDAQPVIARVAAARLGASSALLGSGSPMIKALQRLHAQHVTFVAAVRADSVNLHRTAVTTFLGVMHMMTPRQVQLECTQPMHLRHTDWSLSIRHLSASIISAVFSATASNC